MVRLKIDDTMKYHPSYMPNDKQLNMMLHAIGADTSSAKRYRDKYFFYAYRNGYDADGEDIESWDKLVEMGLAEKNRAYHVSTFGINLLQSLTHSTIYVANCVADAKPLVFRVLARDCASCGYGNWLPTTIKSISSRSHVPKSVVVECLHTLKDEGLVVKDCYGEIDDEGTPHCWHGWSLSDKGKDTDVYKEEYDIEMKRMDELLRGGE